MMKIRVTLFGLIFIAVFCLIKSQRQIIPSNQFFPFQRPNLQLIQLHAQQQQRPSFPPPPSQLNQRRQFRTQQQQITRRPIPSDNRFIPQLQLRTQGNADFSRGATTLAPQRFAPPRQAPPQRPPPPIEVTPSRGPAVRPPVLRRPPLPSSASASTTRTQSMPQMSPQPRQQQQPPPPRSPTQSRQQPSSRTHVPQQQQRPPPPPSTQQQTFLRPPTSPRMSPSMQRPPMPRPQTRLQPPLSPPPQQQQFNQPRPPVPTMPSPPPPQIQQQQQQQQQQRPRITPEQRFTRPDQARMSPPAPVGPPRPLPSMTTNNIDDPSPPLQSRVRPSALSPPPSAHMPGFLPPSNSVVDELNNSKNFLEVARRLHLRRVIRGSAH